MKAVDGIKGCPKCNGLFQLTDFYRNAKTADGLQIWCKVCVREGIDNATRKNKLKWANMDPYTGKPYDE